MGEYLELAAPDGGVVPVLQPVGWWPWVTLLLGIAIIALSGALLSHDADIDPAGTTPSSVIAGQ
ncbi:hypothetical protein [Mycolicibacterium tusciae]|uniref:hypothetical protein n=1 Tax=Mycolicibacterium tusciae TaxID=75922 RepID=UPI00024A4692|nr:hypothetical protein [Mycolicibacterium tusciae]